MNILFSAAPLALITGALSVALTALLIRFSVRLKLTAAPREDRWHKLPTPNTGGVAIFVSCALVYAVAARGQYAVIAATAAGMAVLGFLDDRLQLRPLVKFGCQSVAVAIVLANGVVFRATGWPVLDLVISFLWITGITNAINLIDNMDGLCAGVVIIIAVFRTWFAINTGDFAAAALLMILAGAYAGFLIFNYRPARIFMGDCGSMFAGFALASLTIASPLAHTKAILSGLFYPALTFLYPIFDTMLVSFLRRAAGKPVSVGGRDHSSHRLASLGHSEQKVVWLLWLLTAAGSGAGLLTYWMPLQIHVIGALLVLGVAVFGFFLGTLPAYELPETAPVRSTWIRKRIPSLRAGTILIVETSLAGIALLSAFLLRGEGSFSSGVQQQFWESLPIVMICQAAVCSAFRTYNLGWRWFDSRDLATLGRCTVLGSAMSMFFVWMFGTRDYSRAVIILYGVLFLCFTVGVRVSMRMFWQTLAPSKVRLRAAILGSGATAELLTIILRKHVAMDASPVLILDTDPAAEGTRINGVPVRYAGTQPLKLVQKFKADLLIVSAQHDLSPHYATIIDACRAGGLPVSGLEIGMKPLESAVAAFAR